MPNLRLAGRFGLGRVAGGAWALLLALVLGASALTQALPGSTTLVSVASDGTQANGPSGRYFSSISGDGRFVAFDSSATNLVSGDANGLPDMFVYDQLTGATTRVSVASAGTEGNDHSLEPSISADGRFVAFLSFATNLVAGDTNGLPDVFVHDLATSATTRVSVASDGSQGNDKSAQPSISRDGRFVAFASSATNLVPGDTNGFADVFVHDGQTGETTRVSVASDGSQGDYGSLRPSISADGRFVAFRSDATNFVPDDPLGDGDVFVHDRQTGATTISVVSDGSQGNRVSDAPSISADGRFVAFASLVNAWGEVWHVFVHDRQTGVVTRVSVANDGTPGNAHSLGPSISADGRFVVFPSSATNLVAGDTNGRRDVFVHDRGVPGPR